MNEINFDPVPEHLLHEWTTRLLAGEQGQAAHGIAQRILYDFCTRARLNRPQSTITMNWLADVFDDIIAKGKPDARKAFSLMPRREGGNEKTGEAIDIACWIRLATQRGYAEANAKKMAAAIFCKDEKHIARQLRRASEWADGMNQNFDWDEYFKYKRRPLPPKHSASKRQGTRTR